MARAAEGLKKITLELGAATRASSSTTPTSMLR